MMYRTCRVAAPPLPQPARACIPRANMDCKTRRCPLGSWLDSLPIVEKQKLRISSTQCATALPSQMVRAPDGPHAQSGCQRGDPRRVYGKVVAAWHFCWMPGPKPAMAREMIVLSAVLQRPSPVTSHFLKPGIDPTLPYGGRPAKERHGSRTPPRETPYLKSTPSRFEHAGPVRASRLPEVLGLALR